MSTAAGPVTFAIISNAPAASALLETVCDELTKVTSCPMKPIVLRSYDKLLGSMKDGEVDIAWAPPLVAIDLERAQAGRIRLCSRRAGKPDYSSVLFAARSSKIEKLEDLEGKRAAWVARESSAGYVVPRLKLLAAGHDPDKIFKEQVFRRTHEAVVRAVMAGDADVGATFASFKDGEDLPVTAGWSEAGIETKDVRILAVAGPIPSDVIAVSTLLDDARGNAVVTGLRELGESILRLLNADGFDEPEQAHFDRLRKLVDTASGSGDRAAPARVS